MGKRKEKGQVVVGAHGEFVFCPRLLEGGLQLIQIGAVGRRELGLHASLEAGLGL